MTSKKMTNIAYLRFPSRYRGEPSGFRLQLKSTATLDRFHQVKVPQNVENNLTGFCECLDHFGSFRQLQTSVQLQ